MYSMAICIVWDVDLDVDVFKDVHANAYLSCAPLFTFSCVNASCKHNSGSCNYEFTCVCIKKAAS